MTSDDRAPRTARTSTIAKSALPFAALTALCSTQPLPAHAEDNVTIVGNYYKERSTRVFAPAVVVTKELPSLDAKLTGGYLVDQITSASGAFTPTDAPFQEYRQELKVAFERRFAGWVTPGVNVRYSHEPDYDSISVGADVALAFARDTTTLRAYVQHVRDDIEQRGVPGFGDALVTTLVGTSVTQVLTKDLLGGLAVEGQLLRGYLENPYRVEVHPRSRDRFAAAAWLSYYFTPTATTGRLAYRVYRDDWELTGHTIDARLTQELAPTFAVTTRFRYYSQGDAYFTTPADGFSTVDPKLFAFGSRFYELTLHWTPSFLSGGPLGLFAGSRLEPSYGYLDQDTSYGPAHVAQLAWTWDY